MSHHLGERLSALIDGELSHAQRERVLAHLARCTPCRHEAAALRALKQRMHALGEATANTALTDRLVALGARGPVPGGMGLSRRRWPVRSIAAAFLTVAGLGLPAAAFMAGGGSQQEPGPGVTPAIDMFMMQHELSTGDVPVRTPSASPSPSSTPRQRQHGIGATRRSSLPGLGEPAVDTRSRPSAGTTCPGSDPATLRVITVAVLAGLVVSGIVVISQHGAGGLGGAGAQAMAPPSAPAGLPRATAPTPTLRLLSQAAQACQTMTYQGVEVLGAGPDTSVVDVWHAPGGVTLAQTAPAAPHWSGEAPHIVLPASYLGGQALMGSVMLGMSPRLVALLSVNYRVAAVGWGQVAGRLARVVTAVRPDGMLAARFWLDKLTLLPLQRETFDGRGHLVSDATFATLTVGSTPAARSAVTAPRQWVTARPARLRARGWPLPGRLPGDLALLGAREDDTATGPVVDLDYSDGLSLVSVFLQRGHLQARLTGWSRVALQGSPVYADDSDGQTFVWSAHGFVYTLVAAAPPQTVAQAVAALPHDGSPGLLARMRQGARRLLSWLTP